MMAEAQLLNSAEGSVYGVREWRLEMEQAAAATGCLTREEDLLPEVDIITLADPLHGSVITAVENASPGAASRERQHAVNEVVPGQVPQTPMARPASAPDALPPLIVSVTLQSILEKIETSAAAEKQASTASMSSRRDHGPVLPPGAPVASGHGQPRGMSERIGRESADNFFARVNSEARRLLARWAAPLPQLFNGGFAGRPNIAGRRFDAEVSGAIAHASSLATAVANSGKVPPASATWKETPATHPQKISILAGLVDAAWQAPSSAAAEQETEIPITKAGPQDGIAEAMERLARTLSGIENRLPAPGRAETGTAAQDSAGEVRWLEDDDLAARLQTILKRQAHRRGIDLS